jgi:hypothetical protein
LLDDAKCMLATSSGPRPCPVDSLPSLAQRLCCLGSPIHSVAHPASLEGLSIGLLPVRLIAEELSLWPVKQVGKLRDVGRSRMGHPHRVHQAPQIRPDVQLHPEVPGLALARLLHLRVASLRRVLRRTRRRDDRGILVADEEMVYMCLSAARARTIATSTSWTVGDILTGATPTGGSLPASTK